MSATLRWGVPILACLAIPLAPPGLARAEEKRTVRMAQAKPASMDMGTEGASGLPPALPAASSLPTPPAPIAGDWGIGDFERIAMERNPTLKQAASQYEAALSRSFQAGLYPNPTAGYIQDQIGAFGEVKPRANGITAGGKATPGEFVGAFVRQEIVTGGKLRLSRSKFAEEANAARWQSDAQAFRVRNGVRSQFFEVAAAQRLIEVRRELTKLNDQAVKTTEQLVNVGQANEPDLLQSRVEANRARVALRSAENRHRAAWQGLTALIGAPELDPAPVDDRALEAESAPLEFNASLDRITRCSPELQAALADIRRSQITVRRERAEPIPNLTVQASVGRNYEFGATGITVAGVQVSAPIPVFNRNQGTVREAQSDLARDHSEYRRLVLSLRQRLADAFARYQDASQSVDDFQKASLPASKRAYDVMLANFRSRRAAWPQVLVSQRNYVSLSQEYIQSLLELRKAETEIGGMLLVDGLSTPMAPTTQGHIEANPQPR